MKKLWFIGLTAAVLSFFGMAQATAAILCVEPTGAMGCFTTVQAAVDAAAPGDHIWVTPGVYYENVYVDTSTITIQGGEFTPARRRGVGGWAAVDPTRVIIDARPLCGNVAEAIWIDGAHHVTIANLTVRHADGWDNIYSDGDFTTIDRVHSLSSTLSGVYIVADDATVRNCYITANLYAGVEIYGDDASVTNNAIYNHYYEGVYIEGLAPDVIGNRIDQTEDDGVYLYDADGAVVSQNVIRGAYGYGVYTDDTIECTIANNDIRSCYDGGIYMYYSDDSTVSGNYISAVYGDGIYVYYDTVGQNVVSNNTVEDLYGDGIEVEDLDTTVTGNTVRNVNGSNYGMYVYAEGGTVSNNSVEGVAADYEGYYLDVDYVTVSQNVAQFNAEEGFYIDGDNNVINNNTARHNGHEWEGGFYIYGDDNFISGNLAEMNPGYGFYIYGNNTFQGNTAANNDRTGIYLYGTNGGILQVNANVATNNQGEGIANFASATCNIINNTALGNRLDICDEGPADVFSGNTFATGGPGVLCCLE